MSDQPTDIVFDALRRMESNGAHPHATISSLARLQTTTTSAPTAAIPARTETPPLQKTAASRESTPAPRLDASLLATPPAPSGTAPSAAAPGSKAELLSALRGPVLACVKCPHLVKSRTQVVFGVGNPDAELMFVGEAPGADEDLVGEPFVGKAGQLLTRIIGVMGFGRADVYIANILKCRPDTQPGGPGNRKPTHSEMDTCKPYLLRQIEIIQPKVIVALGATAVEGLLGMEKAGITKMRGTWKEFHGIPLMPTYHPAYLLHNQSNVEKRKLWEDMLRVLERLGRPITEKQQGYFRSAT